jgi:hypothetical protein
LVDELANVNNPFDFFILAVSFAVSTRAVGVEFVVVSVVDFNFTTIYWQKLGIVVVEFYLQHVDPVVFSPF